MSVESDEAGKIYDKLKSKDMPRAAFVKRYCELTDPTRLAQEAKGVVEKRNIDRALRN